MFRIAAAPQGGVSTQPLQCFTQSLAQAGVLMMTQEKYSTVQSLHDDQTIKEAKTTSFHLSMKRAAVHTTEAWFALHLLGYGSDVLPPIAHHPSLQGDNSRGPQLPRGPQAGSGASRSLPCLIPPAHSFSRKHDSFRLHVLRCWN